VTGLAVVTGSTGAIGAATCAALAEAGYDVVGVDQRDPATPPPWRHRTADLGRLDEVARAFTGLQPDVLVNNAGVYLAQDFLSTTARDYDLVMGSNVRAAFFCAQTFARRLVEARRPGVIVNVASVSGRTGSPDVAYGASKGAVIALTRSLGQSLARHGIRVNAVAPGLVHSDMSARIPADRQEKYRQSIPLGRFAEPAEIAAVITMLAGPAGSYLTSSIVDVNGGLW
jgi:NAD(P)-dependent dehydrogenase (short-subunit alcohol dehydrogenase family)